MEHVETLIVGGGQAGLVMSHMLKRRRRPHLISSGAALPSAGAPNDGMGCGFSFQIGR